MNVFNYKIAIIVLFFTVISVVRTTENEQHLVDHYVNLINNRTQAAIEYEFPKDARMYEPEDLTPQEYGIYDFIVVGGGSTGCVVASRLSEILKWKVLLLEAGTFRDEDLTSIPGLAVVDTFTKFNWGFESVPQKTAFLGNTDQKTPVWRGKGVGGSSLINGLGYSRGSEFDFERWSNLLNDITWSYNNLLGLFKKSENFTRTNPYIPVDINYHGYEGPQHVTQCYPPQNVSNTIIRGSQELGYDVVDYNGKQMKGGSVFQFFVKDGFRFDPEMAFIEPVRDRQNFEVLDGSYVVKIDISETTKRAEGVIFTRNNTTYIARAQKEVILSAGAISSPQILMLSGIGPKDHLESLAIPVIQELPVGTTMRDHLFTMLILSSNLTGDSESTEESVRNLLKGQGSLTRSNLYDAVLFLKTPLEQNEDYPDMECTIGNSSDSELGKRYYRWSDETYNALNASVPNPFTISIYYLHTVSNGTLRLKSANPFDYPLIDPNLLSDPEGKDIEGLYQAVQVVLKLIETEAFRSMNVSLAFDRFPGCDDFEPLSKDYWYCYIRRVTALGAHQVATCLSGVSPETSVVDRKLKVFGMEGLRIADASVIPFPLTGHINAACTMVGEKAADIIKGEYGIGDLMTNK